MDFFFFCLVPSSAGYFFSLSLSLSLSLSIFYHTVNGCARLDRCPRSGSDWEEREKKREDWKSSVKEYQKYKILTLREKACARPSSSPSPPPLPTLQARVYPGCSRAERKRGERKKRLYGKYHPPSFSSSLPLSLSLSLSPSLCPSLPPSLPQLMPRLNPFTITFNHYLSFYLLQPLLPELRRCNFPISLSAPAPPNCTPSDPVCTLLGLKDQLRFTVLCPDVSTVTYCTR